MKMNITETVKQARGHWPHILPALGVKVIKTGIRLVRYAAALTVLALTIKRGAGGGSAISVAQVTGLSW
ncbi:Zinc binding domain / DNA primase [Klebsiella pneumoniae]|nr:Zinc binding domain / DNA primase [Klebsiella pneumoniae]